MAGSFGLGIGIIAIGGLFNGTFALPMKYSRRWRWENTWLVFALLSLFIFPIALAIGFVPNLGAVYAGTPIRTLMIPLCFGLLLGAGQVAYGLGIASVGISIAIAVVSGVSCVSGVLVPLIFLHPADIFRPQGILLLVGMPIILIGLVFYGLAGSRRGKEQSKANSEPAGPLSFGAGLAVCTVTGILGSSINLGFAFSGAILRNSVERGATSAVSTYAVWALLFGASFIPNLVYCSFLLFRKHGWSSFWGVGSGKEMGLSSAMALLSFGAFIVYGIGTTAVGKYGTSVGWAAFVAVTIAASTLSGLAMGEWKNTSQRTRRQLAAAVSIMLVTVVILDLGGLF